MARNRQSVKRVILSSSVAAMEKKKAGPINGKLYTEEDWNDEATLDTFPYHLSKKLAEKLAWDLSTEYRCCCCSHRCCLLLVMEAAHAAALEASAMQRAAAIWHFVASQ